MTREWTEEMYLEKVYNILRGACTNDMYRRVRIAKNFDHYYASSDSDEYDRLLNYHEAEGEEGTTPYYKINFDAVSPKLNILLGELNSRGMDVEVSAVNMEAIKRKNVHKAQVEFQMAMQQLYRDAAEKTGVQFGVNDNLPVDYEDLKAYMDKYKDIYEILMQDAVDDDIYTSGYEDLRKKLMLDLLCTNEIHCKNEVRDGITYPVRINPLNFIPDPSCEDDFCSDAQFAIEAYYMPITDAIRTLNLDKEHVEELMELYEEGGYSGYQWKGISGNEGGAWVPFLSTGLTEGFDRILVLKIEFKDVEDHDMKVTHDNHGNMHAHKYTKTRAKLTEKEKMVDGNEIISKGVEVVRKCCLVGGDIITNYGVVENNRKFDSPARSSLSYTSVIHNYNNQESTSLVDKIGRINKYKNYLLTLMQKEITTTVGGYVQIDTAFIDKEIYGVGKKVAQEVLSNLKKYKVMFVNSAQHKGKYNGLPIRDVPARQQNFIKDIINFVLYLDKEMETITSINEARQGGGGERQLASTNEMKLAQSNFGTDTYFQAFYGLEKRLWEKHIERLSILWVKYPEKYEHIAARNGIELPEDIGIDLQSYRAEIRQVPVTKMELRQMIDFSLSQGNLSPGDAIRIRLLANDNIKMGLLKFLEITDRREKQEMEMRQAEINAAAQGNRADKEFDRETQLMVTDRKGQWSAKNANDVAQTQSRNNQLTLAQKDRHHNDEQSREIEKLILESKKHVNGDS